MAMKHEGSKRRFDLNLLWVLEALYKEGSATRASERLGVSQPSVSQALGRLREMLGDPLFVKQAGGLVKTPRGEELEKPVAAIFQILSDQILASSGFDPEASTRTFVFVIGEIGQLLYLDKIFSTIRAQAPQVKVRVISSNSYDAESMMEDTGADLAIGYYPSMRRPVHYQQRLYESRLVCVARRNHSRIADRLTLETLSDLEHVVIGGSNVYLALFEREARKYGFSARMGLEIPSLAAAPVVLAGSDLVAVVPEALGRHFAARGDIITHELPIPVPPLAVKQYWHRRYKDDPANRWLRRIVFELLHRA